MVLPCASVMVIVVLLNDEFTCAMPDAMFLRSRRRTRVASLPIPKTFLNDLNAAVTPAATPDERAVVGEWRTVGAIPTRYSLLPVRQLLLLAGDRLGRTLARARVGVGALTTHRQSAAMTQAAIAAEIHQTLDIHAGLAPQVAFDHIVAVNHLADLQHFLIA